MLDLGRYSKVALFGGAYNNWLALEATLADAKARGAEAIVFLGDAGGFGPHPDRTVELLRSSGIHSIQGNYDESVGQGLEDCGCGYVDPRDNHFAQISYDYTLANTGPEHRKWLGALPTSGRLQIGDKRVLLCHGSPRRVNEFLWESTTPAGFISHLCEQEQTDLIACTHTGIHWERRLDDGRGVINVGAIGRPPNDGRLEVWYTLLESDHGNIRSTFIPVRYDWRRLATTMESEGLPPEFVQTVRTGWWTTCLEILPGRERAAGRF